jgi:ABC-2 type transport system ATP-binding protein
MASPTETRTGQPPALATTHLTKIFKTRSRSVKALDDVTLAVPPGTITGLVGPNGAGKTTLLRCWVGFERPTFGIALVDGRPAPDSATETGWVAYLPQQTRLYRTLSADDHLVLARALRPGFDAVAAADFLTRRGIEHHRPVGQLSGGQQAQVAIAIALHAGATTILLDEPLASLDPLQRAYLLEDIKASAARGVTILLSSHIVGDLEGAVDRIILLRSGRVILSERVADLLATHRVVPRSIVPDGARPIGPIAGSGELGDLLCAVDPTVPGSTAKGSRRPTLNELVLAYLAAELPDGSGNSNGLPMRTGR